MQFNEIKLSVQLLQTMSTEECAQRDKDGKVMLNFDNDMRYRTYIYTMTLAIEEVFISFFLPFFSSSSSFFFSFSSSSVLNLLLQ